MKKRSIFTFLFTAAASIITATSFSTVINNNTTASKSTFAINERYSFKKDFITPSAVASTFISGENIKGTINYSKNPITKHITLVSSSSDFSGSNIKLKEKATIEGVSYVVDGIMKECFMDRTNLTGTVTIPSSFNYIGKDVFKGTSLNKYEDNLIYSTSEAGSTAITKWCLGYRDNEDRPISEQDPIKFKIESDTQAIAESVFENCLGLTGDLDLSTYQKLKFIGSQAFQGCTYINGYISIPQSVTNLGWHAFYKTSLLTDRGQDTHFIFSKRNVSGCNEWCIGIIKDGITQKDKNVNEQFPDLNGVYGIGAGAFQGDCGVTLVGDISIPNSIKYIGDNAFKKCESLTGSFVATDNLLSIGNSAFSDVPQLESINLSNATHLTSIGNFAFYNCANNSEWNELTLPSNLEIIGNNAFENVKFIKLNLAKSKKIRYLGEGAFKNCSLMNECTRLPSALTEMKDECFFGCSSLKSIDLSYTSLIYLSKNAFYNCTSLSGEIIIPSSVTYIGEGCFNGDTVDSFASNESTYLGCTKISTIKLLPIIPPHFNGSADDNTNWAPKLSDDAKVIVPYGSKSNYVKASSFNIDDSKVVEQKSSPISQTRIIEICIVAAFVLIGSITPLIIYEIIKNKRNKLLIFDMESKNVSSKIFKTEFDKEEHKKIVAKEKKEEEESKKKKNKTSTKPVTKTSPLKTRKVTKKVK